MISPSDATPKVTEVAGKVRSRVLACEFYEDGEGKNYATMCDILEELHIQAAISPLHDKDCHDDSSIAKWIRNHKKANGGKLSAEDEKNVPIVGQLKKPHYHVLLVFSGSKSNKQLREYFAPLGITYFFVPPDKRVYFRYLAHMDSPTKARYDEKEIVTFGGMDRSPLVDVTEEQQFEALRELCEYVNEYRVTEFCSLVDHAFDADSQAYLDVLVKRSSFWGLYLTSKEHSFARQRDYQGDIHKT